MNHKKLNSKEQFNNLIQILKDLHKSNPDIDLCRHIADATAEYPNIWSITNKEFLHLLEKYKFELENNIVTETDIARIYKEGNNVEHILEDEDPFYEFED